MTAEELRDRLSAFIARETGARSVEIEGLQRMPGGASREIWRLDASYDENGAAKKEALVLRRDPAGRGGESNRGEEFQLLRAAHAEGVPVPKVFWLGDENAGLDG